MYYDDASCIISAARNIQCELCGKRFKTPQHAYQHRKTVHEGRYRFRCEKCGHGMEKEQYLKSHRCGRVRRIQDNEISDMPGGINDVLGGISDVPGGIPNVPGGISNVPGGIPNVPGGIPNVPGGIPNVPDGIITKVPGIIPNSSSLIPNLKGKITDMPSVVQNMPGVVQNMPGVVQNMPGVVQNMPGVVQNMPGVVQNMPGVLPDMLSVLPNMQGKDKINQSALHIEDVINIAKTKDTEETIFKARSADRAVGLHTDRELGLTDTGQYLSSNTPGPTGRADRLHSGGIRTDRRQHLNNANSIVLASHNQVIDTASVIDNYTQSQIAAHYLIPDGDSYRHESQGEPGGNTLSPDSPVTHSSQHSYVIPIPGTYAHYLIPNTNVPY